MVRHLGLLALLGGVLLGCSDDDSGNQADAGQVGDHRLVILDPPGVSIGLAPNEPVTLRVQYLDPRSAPVADGRIEFSIQGDGGGSSLGGFDAYTDGNGIAEMQLNAGSEETFFDVTVAAPDALPVTFEVAVSEGGFTAIEVLPTYAGEHDAATFASVRAQMFFDSRCEERSPGDAASPHRQRFATEFDEVLVFENLPVNVDYAVVLRGQDAGGALLAWGCAEVANPQLIPGVTVRLHLTAADVPISPAGTYQVDTELVLPPSALPAVTAALQPARQLGECDFGLEQHLLDCLLDARFPDGTLDCVPQTNDATAREVQALRGIDEGDGCRADRTSLGDPSLEATLRATVDATGLSGLDALATLAGIAPADFGHLRTLGQLTFVVGDGGAGITLWHRLDQVGFPDVAPDLFIPLALQGHHPLEVASLLASYQAGAPPRLTLPTHGLALKPTWSAWALVRTWLLEPVGLPGEPAALLARLLAAYHATQLGAPVAGCPALETQICQALGRADDCLTGACEAGVTLLEQHWTDAWSALPPPVGADARFTADVVLTDLDGDLQADQLGSTTTPASWLLTIDFGGQVVAPTTATFSATRLATP